MKDERRAPAVERKVSEAFERKPHSFGIVLIVVGNVVFAFGRTLLVKVISSFMEADDDTVTLATFFLHLVKQPL